MQECRKGLSISVSRVKEDFGLELIDYNLNFFASMIESHLKGPEVSPLKRLQSFFEGFRSIFEQYGCKGGCPIGNLTQEMGGQSDTFQDKPRHALNRMKAGILPGKSRRSIPLSMYLQLRILFLIAERELCCA